MPPCHCIAHSCRGRNVSEVTHRQHRSDSNSYLSGKFQQAGTAAVQAYEEKLGQHLLEHTLCNSIPPSRSRLWGKSLEQGPISSALKDIASALPPSHSAQPVPPGSASSFDMSPLGNALGGISSTLQPATPSVPKATANPRGRPSSAQRSSPDSSLNPSNSPVNHTERVRYTLDKLTSLECRLDHVSEALDAICKATIEDPECLSPLYTQAEEISRQLQSISIKAHAVVVYHHQVEAKLEAVVAKLDKFQGEMATKPPTPPDSQSYDTSHHFANRLNSADPPLQVIFFVLVTLTVIFRLPHRAGRFMLQTIRYAFQLALTTATGLRQQDRNFLSGIPVDPDTVFQYFNLDRRHTIYAVCPNLECHKLYPPTFLDGSPIAQYPTQCHERAFGSLCNEFIVRSKVINGKEVLVPIKSYVYFHFKDWLSSLLSRPGIEEKLDASWNQAGTSELHDIFDGSGLKEFQGPDGKPFLDGGEEGRYAFSLCCDFFNSLGNKQAGKSQSIGMIALVCLNLPPDLHYKPENMFLAGVVPGPNEPRLDYLNRYLSPLVTEFLNFWDVPVRFTRTHAYPGGRCTRCALLLVVCDLPAARKVAGYASHSHTSFCSLCHCRRDKEGYVGMPYSQWQRRTNEEYREAARNYASAANSKVQEDLVKSNGFRCSELLRLPYFDPSRFVVVDAMHNLFLGLVHEHCTGLLGLGKRQATPHVISVTLPTIWPNLSTAEQESVKKICAKLEGPLCERISQDPIAVVNSLASRHLKALEFIARTIGVYPLAQGGSPITKETIANALVTWRALQQEVFPPNLHGGFLQELRKDIAATKAPSWVESVPKNLGEAGHGKLKASQWRSLGLVYMPASLVRLWGESDDKDTHPLRRHNRRTLEVTMSLLSAISIATADSTSVTSARLYLSHLQAYVDGVKELYPDYVFKPNHHMVFHIAEYLEVYGPVRGWWVFPFERVIGMLQRIPTNHVYTQYEETISKSFTRAANLRAFLQQSDCPPALRHTDAFFRSLLNQSDSDEPSPNLLGSLTEGDTLESGVVHSHRWTGQTKALPSVVVSALVEMGSFATRGVLCSYILLHGIHYSTKLHHCGNSQIMVKDSRSAAGSPAIIQYIVIVEDAKAVKTLLGIQWLKPFRAKHDPFSQYSFLHLSLHASCAENILEFVPLNHTCG